MPSLGGLGNRSAGVIGGGEAAAVWPHVLGCVAVSVICVGVAPVIVNTTPGLPSTFMFAAVSLPLAKASSPELMQSGPLRKGT